MFEDVQDSADLPLEELLRDAVKIEDVRWKSLREMAQAPSDQNVERVARKHIPCASFNASL